MRGFQVDSKLKAEFKILCNTEKACPEVKKVLEDLKFTNLKDLDKSPSYDISAKIELENDEAVKVIAHKIFDQCREKVQTIQITT